jgi:hypothetical protein
VTAGTPCTSDGNVCTEDECDGAGTCAHPAGNPGAVCRASTGDCDAEEDCDGASVGCPGDLAEPDGTACDDGDACTTGDQCSGGVCDGGPPTVCALCETCDSLGGCVAAPRTDCKQSLVSGKSKLTVNDKTPDTSDGIVWKWGAGDETDLIDLADPLTTDDYALCIYEAPADTPLFTALVPAGGTCGTKPCWSAVGTTGFKYGDKEATPHGAQKTSARTGIATKAKALFKGKGVNLSASPYGMPAPPLATPVRVQLQVSGGACFEATYSSPITNLPGSFKATSD